MTTSTERTTVLYVDGDANRADTAAVSLERADERITVQTATDAGTGVEVLADADIDCVVSAYELPGQNGIEFLEAVREEHPDLPFILRTDAGSERVASAAISAGVTDYIRTERGTAQSASLADRIREAVSSRQSAGDSEQSRHRLEQVLKTVPSCVVQLDREGRFIFANERAVEVLGLERAELTDRTYNDPEWNIRDLDGNPIPDEQLPFQRVRTSGKPLYGFRHTIEWPDGTEKKLLVNGTPLFDSQGAVESVVCSLTDITARVERESRLEETTARLEALFENSPDMINVHDADGNIIDPNRQLCEATGYSREELTDMKVWDLDQTVDPADITDIWEEMAIGARHKFEGVYRHRDGTTFPVEVHIRRLDLDGGNRFVVISRDISEREQREQELQQERDRFRAVFEKSFDSMVIANDDGEYIEANESATELFGLERDELLGRSIEEFAPADFEYEQAWGNFQKSEQQRGTFPLIRADGTERTVEYAATMNVTPGQHLSVLRDITDREKRERELERQNERLEEFASVVSHDLRNPLNVAAARLELAHEECNSEHHAAIERAHDRMEALIDDLLTLARHGETPADIGSVDLAELVESCWQTVETNDATLVTDIDRTIRADERQLRQLFENLVRNAIEHGGDGVTVTVGTLDDGFYVEDDGPGIPPDDFDDVFDTSYSTSQDGTGFGLSIVKQIVEAHGWEIRVTEGAEGGARFEIVGVEFETA
ncbi:MAG: PAS domain S-box protein [Haloarculaceae archaeon]